MTAHKALALHVTGIVQGVGFRPFVYNLATELGLHGWVLNASDGVHCLVEGPESVVDAFPARLAESAPEMAVIDQVIAEEVELTGATDFSIRSSREEKGAMTLVSPDIATCAQCASEVADPRDHRYGYPFTNCTNCGPRFTIIRDVPYDRPTTTMRDFPMCDACAAEYGDPSDRRFHAQPNACFVCGPRLFLMPSPTSHDPAETPSGECAWPAEWRWAPEVEVAPRPHRPESAERQRSDAVLAAAGAALREGRILAVKGLGGFHLACSATDEAAVARLRERKRRWGKPLAIMVRDLDEARRYCEVNDEEAGLLSGAVRPIVLLRRRADGHQPAGPWLAEGLAPALCEIGVMLPYTPLHHLLLEAAGVPLVMTSGNLSEEPIATSNAEALQRLATIAEAFLLHDREIYCRYDDSVVRVVGGVTELVRRARGYAPFPLALPFTTDLDILAVGPEQKNTFTLLTGRHAFVSQHIGDLENAETLESFDATLALYENLFRIEPKLVAHDLHPEYLSTKWALASGLPSVGVQHHHAHIASVSAEHGVADPVVGIAFDGTGYGSDGHIWGGEVLIADWTGFERFAHLRYVAMPGGAGAIRRPARMAVGTLLTLNLLDHPGAQPLRGRLAPGEERTLATMVERGVNTPLTSSMGRLFDTVAAVIGIADDARYEGEAAILLEAAADPAEAGSYEFEFAADPTGGARLIIDPTPVLLSVLEDVAAQIPTGVIAKRFHAAVTGCIVATALKASEQVGTRHVALAGGVFLNRLVFGSAIQQLQLAGLLPLTHTRLPVNDAAVSFGQAVVAWAQRHELGS